jgi:hypothetical protein
MQVAHLFIMSQSSGVSLVRVVVLSAKRDNNNSNIHVFPVQGLGVLQVWVT